MNGLERFEAANDTEMAPFLKALIVIGVVAIGVGVKRRQEAKAAIALH